MSKTFLEITTAQAELLEKKNAAYGNAFNKTTEHLNLLFPDGVVPEQYSDLMFIVRILDKLNRIANSSLLPPEEGKLDAYRDISGYATLGIKAILDSDFLTETSLKKEDETKNDS